MSRKKIFTRENWKRVPFIGLTVRYAIDEAKAAMRAYDEEQARKKAEEPKKPERWIVVKRKDGKVWRGPFFENGKSFTVVEDRWCVFASREEAENYALDENLKFGWEAVQV